MDHHKQFHKYNCYGTVTAGEKIAGDAMELVTIFLHAMFKAFNICTRYQGIVNHEDKELHSELGKFTNWMFRNWNLYHKRYLQVCVGKDSKNWMNIRTLCNIIIVLAQFCSTGMIFNKVGVCKQSCWSIYICLGGQP